MQVLSQILTIPHLPARLLALLPFCSPINDLLLLLLRVSRPPSPLVPSAVTQTIRMLDPFSALGKPGHVAAEELLRGIIEICLAVPRAQGGAAGPGGAPFGGTLLDWVLAGQDEAAPPRPQPVVEVVVEEGTPVAAPAPPPSEATASEAGSPTVVDEQADDARQRELRTSSLISSLAVLTELIRKNNSDFVEQQMLTWARRRQAAEAERELLEADGAEVVRDPRDDGDERVDDKGPSVVDLGTMLSLVARRIGEFQQLVQKPRSSVRPSLSLSPSASPLLLAAC